MRRYHEWFDQTFQVEAIARVNASRAGAVGHRGA